MKKGQKKVFSINAKKVLGKGGGGVKSGYVGVQQTYFFMGGLRLLQR